MRIFDRLPVIFVITFLVGGWGVFAWEMVQTSEQESTATLTVPKLSPLAMAGQKAFNANCAVCHGGNGAGTDKGPPLLHDIYNPGHHGDAAFFLAAKQGVRQHHWRFGNMAPLPQVSDEKMTAIVRYIRELQVANGITERPHRM